MTGLDLHDGFTPIWSTQGEYATETFTTKAVKLIQNATSPYLLVISHLAPHASYNDQMEVPNVEETNKKYSYIADPNRRLSIGNRDKSILLDLNSMKLFLETVNRLDASVGTIIQTLKDEGQLENSIIMFLSDNGAQTFGEHQNFGSNWPLRGVNIF